MTLELEYDLRSPQFINNPYATYRLMRDQAPVWRSPHTAHIYITQFDDIKQVLMDTSHSSDRIDERLARVPDSIDVASLREMLVDRLVMTDGVRHRELRRKVGSAFTAVKVRSYGRDTSALIDRVFAKFTDRKEIDVINDIALPIPSAVVLSALGFRPQDHTTLRANADDFYRWLAHSPESISERTIKAINSVTSMSEYLHDEVIGAADVPANSYLDQVRAEMDEGSMTPVEVVANLIGLLNAAHETTTSLIANGTIALIENPDQLQRLIEQPDLIPLSVEEMLRFESPAQIISRVVTEDFELRGVQISKGELLALVLGSANRDERKFTNPDSFDVTRDEGQNLAFGHGSHFCTGGGLARLEAIMVFRHLVPLLPKAIIESAPITWRPTPAFRGPEELQIRLDQVAITIAEFGGNWWQSVNTHHD